MYLVDFTSLDLTFAVSPLQDDNGKFNFDQNKVINPESGELVSIFFCPHLFKMSPVS